MNRPLHAARGPKSTRPLRALFGLLALALVLAACTTPTTPVPNFSLSFSGGGSGDGTVEVEQGASLDVTVSVQGSGGFSGVVTLSSGVETAQVAGIDIAFDPATTGTSSTMTIDIGAGVAFDDDYTLTVTGTSGSINRTATLTIDVTEASGGSFDLTTSTPSVVAAAGGSADVTVTSTPIAGFTGDVSLALTSSDGISGAFVPDPIAGANGNSTLTLSVPGALAAGSYTVTVNGTSGLVTDSVDVTVIVIDGSTIVVDESSGNDTTGDGSVGNPVRTITNALTLVASGGQILVQDGTYDTETFPLTITDDVTIQGESRAGTVIDGEAISDTFFVDGGNLTISNLTIDGGNDAIQVQGGSDLTASNLTIENFANRGLHVASAGGSTVSLTGSTITAGTGTSSDLIELINPNATISVSDTDIDGSAATATTPEGIDMKEGVALTLDNVTISNVPDGGLEIDDSVSGASSVTVSNSTITGSGGVGLAIASDLTTIDFGVNNAVSGSGGIEFSDQRGNGGVTVIDATGLTLNGTDVADGTVAGPATSGDLYEIVNDTMVNFGF
jgi:hypothetical protein